MWVGCLVCADDHSAEVKGPATTGTTIDGSNGAPSYGSGEVDRYWWTTGLRYLQWIRSRTGCADRMPDLRSAGAVTLCDLWFLAQLNFADHAERSLGCLELQPFGALLSVAALREVRIAACLVCGGACGHDRCER